MVSSDICSYMVPPNMETPRHTSASRGTCSTQARASAGLLGFCVKNGCVRAIAMPQAQRRVRRS
eukprot:12716858-Heterocapsa_arctica.AAC.1